MSTQRTFKRRVRARMQKTGEAYTTARLQLLRKAGEPTATGSEGTPRGADTTEPVPVAASEPAATPAPTDRTPPAASIDPALLPTSDEAMRRASGRSYAEWFGLLDARGAGTRSHTEIAAWLVAEQGVPGWWAQSITVGYERARGRRAIHQVAGGYSVGANRTINLDAERLLAEVIDAGQRAGWLRERPAARRNSQGLGLRLDWSDPPSRVALFVAEKGPGKATVSVQHEKLPDAAAGDRLKAFWRDELLRLKADVERGG